MSRESIKDKKEEIENQQEINQSENQADDLSNVSQESVDSEVENLEKEQDYKEDIEKEKDKYIRLFAEFENYKRRTSKERVELFKTANQEVLQALLPILDDFDRAITELSKLEDKTALEGVTLIHDKLLSTLNQKGLQELEIKQGDEFNSDFAEAITQIPALEKSLKGKVVDVVEKGYKLGDKIIRYPKVVVGQ